MSKVGRCECEAACVVILGNTVVETMEKSGFSLIRIMDIAARQAFIKNLKDPYIEWLREGLSILDRGEYLL
jgi:hypothetical protein